VGVIDGPELIRGAFGILGLSIALAAWSYAFWWAGARSMPRRRVIGLPLFTVPFFTGLALFSLGLAWGADRLWMRLAWIVVGVWSLWEIVRGWRTAGSRKSSIQEELDETH
jgi:hypothetical protein